MGKIMIVLLFVALSSVQGYHVPKEPVCPEHAHYTDCIPSHQMTCANQYNIIPECGGDCSGKSGCVCDVGWMWDANMECCIRPEDCCDYDVCCLPGFVFQQCGKFQYCDGCNTCPLTEGIHGRKGCFCPDNQFLLNGKCVYKHECPIVYK